MNKDKVSIQGVLCDVEISDLKSARSINVADFRNASWDKDKSLHFGVDLNNLSPNRRYVYRYLIKFSRPSLTVSMKTDGSRGNIVSNHDDRGFFSVTPKQQIVRAGYYHIRPGDAICCSSSARKTVDVVETEIQNLTGIRLTKRAVSAAISTFRGIFIEKKVSNNRVTAPEYYEIDISEDRIHVRCSHDRGCLYGAYTLLEMIHKEGNEWMVKAQAVKDWPDLPLRAIVLEVLRPAIRDVTLFKRYLDAFSRARINTIIFFHEPRQILAWRKGVDEGWWTKKQIVEIVGYARSLHMNVIGGMGSKFDNLLFPQLDIVSGSDLYNPYNDNAYKFLFSLYEEILHAYKPSAFLIGHDEIKGLSIYASKYKKNSAEIYSKGISTIYNWFTVRKIPVILAGDMLLDWSQWKVEAGAGEANSLNPIFNSGATHWSINSTPKDISILDWHYENQSDYQTIKYFQQKGFRVLACSWHNPQAAKNLAYSASRYGAKGLIGSDYGFWTTLSPAATTLYTPLFAWSLNKAMSEGDRDVIVLADFLREKHSFHSLRQLPIDMAVSANRSTWYKDGQVGNGIFGLGSFLDLRSVVPGTYHFGKVLFDINDPKKGSASNCLVVENSEPQRRNDDSTKGVIRLKNTKAVFIAFLHTAVLDQPRYNPHAIGQYNVVYKDGSRSAI
ncbi:MAG: glycoside hydrolase family 20 zincin-like fold domain-containing protein, partial [Rectinema sp.]